MKTASYIKTWNDVNRLDTWANTIRKQIKNEILLNHFEQDFKGIVSCNEFTRASFVMYWELQTDSLLATVAPPLVQGTFVSMINRLSELGKVEEIEVLNAIMINFTRIMQVMNSGDINEEE